LTVCNKTKMQYSRIVHCFEQAGYPVKQINNQRGCIATIAAGARVIAVADSSESESFFFNPAGIEDKQALAKNLFYDDGAPGGDRLWIAPEYLYHWRSLPADYINYSNYQRATEIDPGLYQITKEGGMICFSSDIRIKNHFDGQYAKMHVNRHIRQLRSPFTSSQTATVSYQIDQSLTVIQGIAGLWNLAQLPAGSAIIFPLRESVQPLNYFCPSDTRLDGKACAFYINGKANAKIGYGADVATGNSAAFTFADHQLSLVYRSNQVIEDGYYCDGIDQQTPNNQVWQAWDGFGFGELEYHSVAAGEETGRHSVSDISELHCVRGDTALILEIASEVLELPVEQLMRLLSGRVIPN